MGRPERFDSTTGVVGDPGGLPPKGVVFCES